ncbi:MAG: DNA polymerase III subunit alpha [Candidatus Omnitrophica bacterium]|nr:DNA polymerase III subunit alpha [Candidatus Omnitrophota bacterium]
MIHSDFVHLHVHSQYSLLDGACQISKLIDTAQALRMPALGITDHGNIFGAIEFYIEANKKGVKPIIGCEIYVAKNSRHEKGEKGIKSPNHHLTLLIKDEEGYHNLMRLVSIAYLEGFYYKPRIDKEVLSSFSKGLIALSGCLKGEIASLILADQEKNAVDVAVYYRDLFGPDNFYLEIMDHGLKEQQQVNKALIKLGRDLGIPLIATNDVHYLKKEMAIAHEVLLCIQTQTTLSDNKRMKFSTNEFYFKSADEIKRIFHDVPKAISNTIKITEMCNLELDFNKIHFPHYKLPDGVNEIEFLDKLCQEKIPALYQNNSQEAKDRLIHELSVIKTLGFTSYFLIVSDFVRFAKENKIPVGPGRGSAAGSIVSYLLGITQIDPLKYDLLFERFLNPKRISFPDIDIDFCYERRDEVIKYVTEKYGKDNVAQIITFGTMAAKGVVRDVGRVLDIPYAEVDKIAKLIPNDLNISLAQAVADEPDLALAYKSNDTIKKLIDIAYVLEGLTRHASTHAAGVVISDKPLHDYIPLFKSNDDQITTGYTMKSIEKIGLLKMDFLGLKTLTVINETLKIIKRTKGLTLDISQLELADKKTLTLFKKANTFGVFQLESSGMRDLLKRLSPDKFEDIIALLALYRPGPLGSGMVDDFIKRKREGEKTHYDHPLLEPILKNTHGIILYQEQVMRITNVLAGFSLSQADLLRRAMSKKTPEVIENMKKSFIEGAAKNNIKHKIAEKIFSLIEFFAGYGFNKSHSTAYALISYQTAFLKAHYPVEFMAALLTSEKDNMDKIALYINEAARMKIKILPPDINESYSQFTVVGEDTIRFGLTAVKNVGGAAVETIINCRKSGGPFISLFNFCERGDSKAVNKKVIESLIKCGAFDRFSQRRAQLANDLESILGLAGSMQKDKQNGQLLLFEDIQNTAQKNNLPAIEEWPLPQLLSFEKAMLGFYITAHPLQQYQEILQRYSIPSISQIINGENKTQKDIIIAGILEKVKITVTKRTGEKMAILKVADTESSIEVLVFPQVYKQSAINIQADAVVIIKGRLDMREENPKIISSLIVPIETANQELVDSIRLNISTLDEKDKVFHRLKEVLLSHPGKIPVHLQMYSKKGKSVKIKANAKVEVNSLLLSELERLLNKEDIFINLKN